MAALHSLAGNALDVSIAGIRVTDRLDLELRPGEFWALLGPNGVGKTTLLRCLAGLDAPEGGKVRFAGRDIATLPRKLLARHIGMLQQHTVYVFDARVLQTALTGRHPHLAYWQRESSRDIETARRALERVGLGGFEERSVTGLSGGEARRLAFATLLVQEPDIMLLDEPSNHLDLRHQLQVMGMIRERTDSGRHAACAALHDINLAARYCSHVLMLFGNGEWCAGRTADMLGTEALERLYGCPVDRLEGAAGPHFYPAPG